MQDLVSELRRITLPKLSKKSLGGVSSVGIAAITQLNGPLLPRFGASWDPRFVAGRSF
jgi:hypothetical protein